jgi:periplasmic protein TonB
VVSLGLASASSVYAQVKPLISVQDYPPSSLAEHEQGTVYYRLKIGADGHVKDCRVTKSSGFPNLDRASCRLLAQRARFKPALDRAGQPIESTYEDKLDWRLSE